MSNVKDSRYRNVHYKEDTEFTVWVAKTLLTPVGVWPLRTTESLLDTVKLVVHIGIIFCLMCFLLVPHVIYTYHDAEDLARYMKVIAAQVFSLLAIIKFWTVIIKKRYIRYCLMEMETQYRDVECEEDRAVMKKSAGIGRLFTIVYLSLSYGGALPYHIILPLMSERVVKSDNTTQIPLPYLSNYVFFVIEDSPAYEITFVSQILISSIILSTNCGIYSMIATISMHCCGLFQVVSRQIKTLFEYDDHELCQRLRDIVMFHLKAIKYAEAIENALSTVFLTEMLGCTIIICFLEYGVILEWADYKILSTMTYVVLMISTFVNVFIIAYIGDCLRQESERVGETSYFVSWYDLPDDLVKNLKMIMLRTNRPTNFTAAKVFDVSLLAFCDVCKTSAAYLNFLRTMTS
ncbi:odorant receptor 43a-like [Nomia melanderi]|uniref:odorant receptor 43a-like n=1 Tax=Nomia melanderi TaxID=2448451 RepID=UPI00130468DB|nr:odorant receptor 85b-like [Nomia melanderi]